MLSKSKKIFTSMFSEIPNVNVYMQHKPFISTVVDNVMKAKLSAMDYPSTAKDANTQLKPTNVIVFIVGGATYEETADLSTTYN